MPELTPREIQQALAQPFAPEDLEWRLQNTIEDKMRGMAVPYVTNRAIQNRLDEVCGPENWYNDFKPWHSNGKKEAQLCGIAIYFEGRGFITKWDGAEDSDIEPVKGGLSDSMKRAAYQWGIGRVLYSLDTVWVDIERRGKSYVIKDSERPKLDKAYLNTLLKLGLTPAAAGGIQSLLTPKQTLEEAPSKSERPAGSTNAVAVQSGKQDSSTQRPVPSQQAQTHPRSADPLRAGTGPQCSAGSDTSASAPECGRAGNTVPFTQPVRNDLYIVREARVQSGMTASNTLVLLECPDKKRVSAFVRGTHAELIPGCVLRNVKLATRKQDTVVFHVLEAYEYVGQKGQAA